MRLSCEDHVNRNAARTYVRNSRMRVPSARYVSQSRMASLKGISLISKQFTHLHGQPEFTETPCRCQQMQRECPSCPLPCTCLIAADQPVTGMKVISASTAHITYINRQRRFLKMPRAERCMLLFRSTDGHLGSRQQDAARLGWCGPEERCT